MAHWMNRGHSRYRTSKISGRDIQFCEYMAKLVGKKNKSLKARNNEKIQIWREQKAQEQTFVFGTIDF